MVILGNGRSRVSNVPKYLKKKRIKEVETKANSMFNFSLQLFASVSDTLGVSFSSRTLREKGGEKAFTQSLLDSMKGKRGNSRYEAVVSAISSRLGYKNTRDFYSDLASKISGRMVAIKNRERDPSLELFLGRPDVMFRVFSTFGEEGTMNLLEHIYKRVDARRVSSLEGNFRKNYKKYSKYYGGKFPSLAHEGIVHYTSDGAFYNIMESHKYRAENFYSMSSREVYKNVLKSTSKITSRKAFIAQLLTDRIAGRLYAKAIKSALESNGTYPKKTIYRGVNLNREKFAKEIQNLKKGNRLGSILTRNHFNSWSMSKDAASSFCLTDNENVGIIVRVKNPKFKGIKINSDKDSIYHSEEEFLTGKLPDATIKDVKYDKDLEAYIVDI